MTTHQYVPDILISSLVAAEANAGTQEPLAAPHVTGHHVQLSDPRGFSAVHFHPHGLLHVGFQDLLQQVVFLILAQNLKKQHALSSLVPLQDPLYTFHQQVLRVFCYPEKEWSQRKAAVPPSLQGN